MDFFIQGIRFSREVFFLIIELAITLNVGWVQGQSRLRNLHFMLATKEGVCTSI